MSVRVRRCLLCGDAAIDRKMNGRFVTTSCPACHAVLIIEFDPPDDVYWNDETYQGEAYAAYSWSCNVAEVQVDPVDYAARLTSFTSTVECGRVINPVLAEGQIQGGIAQGIGFALYENVVVENGAMKNNQYTNYIVPTAADTPNIDVEFIEFPYANPGPFSAKGIGEMPIDGPAPAIAAAVADALPGTVINEVPLLPERIMAAVVGDDSQAKCIGEANFPSWIGGEDASDCF